MDPWRQAVALGREDPRLALATVIGVSGSAPRHPGAAMLVRSDRSIFGTIGGGRVELEVTAAAAEVAGGAPARRVRYHLVRDLAMCCGGAMELYIEPVAQSLEVLERAVGLVDRRESALLITPLDGSAKRIAPAGDAAFRGARVEGEELVEAIRPSDRAVVFGCGHVARALGPLLGSVGFEVAVCDDDETGELERVPSWADAVVTSFSLSDVERSLGALGRGDYVVIVTRDHGIDQRLLETLLPNDRLAYLGVIGSRGKIGRFRKRLVTKGVATEERWSRLRAPIGLDIGAETPEEIAVAVVAELVAVRNKGRA